MKDFSIDIKWLAMLQQGAEARGLDCTPLLLKHGISSLSVRKQASRVPLEAFAAFASDSMVALNDEYLGLAEKPQPLGSFHLFTRAAISAKTIEHSLKISAQYWNLFDNSYIHKVTTDDRGCTYSLHPKTGFEPLNDYLVSAILSSVHRFHCWVGGQFLALEYVDLDHEESDLSAEYLPLFYGTRISFNKEVAAIRFPLRHLDSVVTQTPETLSQYIKGTNLSLIYQPKNFRVISDQVRQWLERSIKQGNYRVTLKEASGHFKISQQVLHRRLAAEKTSFKEIKKATRRDIAIRLLFEDHHKIEEIAIKVGFSEPSAFIRAFKSWTGKTPRNYRQSELYD